MQEIIVYLILTAVAVYLLIRLFRKKKPKNQACQNCGSRDACSLYELTQKKQSHRL